MLGWRYTPEERVAFAVSFDNLGDLSFEVLNCSPDLGYRQFGFAFWFRLALLVFGEEENKSFCDPE